MTYTAQEIAEGFNTASERKHWKARYFNLKSNTFVSFDDDKSMVALQYHVERQEFQVKFRKAVGQFGDYANAIARALTSILTTLQAAGLPFVAPQSAEGVEVLIKHHGAGNVVTCRIAKGGEPVQMVYTPLETPGEAIDLDELEADEGELTDEQKELLEGVDTPE